MKKKSTITGIILAGGKSSRMGHDKAMLLYKNKPFIAHSINALKPLVETILIVGDNKQYDPLGYNRVNDIVKDAGPLSGIVSGLQASATHYNLVVTCDVPLLTTEVLTLLTNAISNTDAIIQLKTQLHEMPLLAIYPKSCLPVLEKSLFSGNRTIKIALENCTVKNVVVDSSLEKFIENINTKKQFNKLNETNMNFINHKIHKEK